MLRDHFRQLILRYTPDENLAAKLWEEIVRQYSAPGRHYHNLTHLEEVKTQLEGLPLHDADALHFALYYHDIIYKATGSANEEESAVLASERLAAIGVPAPRIEQCRRIILATKQHEATGDADTDAFTDADLAILAAPQERYTRYAQDVRREYAVYPDLLYKPGRRKVLRHFLNMPHIFKTAHFQERCEAPARANLAWELAAL
jgi:predicted metal-dependent HD superfamily phosphohydrolase